MVTNKETNIISTMEAEDWANLAIAPQKEQNQMLLDYLIHEGLGDIAAEYAVEVNLPFKYTAFLRKRSSIRKAVEMGDIDNTITQLNDLNIEILDNNVELYYYLMMHRATEDANSLHEFKLNQEDPEWFDRVEAILRYVREEVAHILTELPNLTSHMEDFLEYLIFNSKNFHISEKRRTLANYINEIILDKYNIVENNLKIAIKGIVYGEEKLSLKYKFPKFKDSFI